MPRNSLQTHLFSNLPDITAHRTSLAASAGDFKKMMAVPSISPVAKLHEEYKKNIAVPDAVLDKLCREAESSHMGVRYLKARLQDELDRQIFDDPDSQSYVLFCDDKHTKGIGQCIP